MMNLDPQMAKQMLQMMLQPWHEAVANPAPAQEAVLQRLLKDYAKTGYGAAARRGQGGQPGRLPPRLPHHAL